MKTNNHKNFDINEYFVRWLDGRLNAAEQHRLDAWLAAEENRKAWDRLQAVWRVSEPPVVPEGTPVAAQWRHLANRLPKVTKAGRALASPSILDQVLDRIRAPRVRAAFAGSLMLAAFALVYSFYSSAPQLREVTVPFGQQMEIVLSDGSEVLLNAGSSIKYPDKFTGDIRLVEMEGEAYFKIESDEIPFVVATERVSTRVLGTEFNVRTWDSATKVFVYSGRVAVHSNIAVQATEVEILPNQLAICKDESITVQPTERPGDLLSWRHGRLVFSNQPLPEILAEVRRIYGVEVTADNRLLGQRLSATFDKEPFLKVVESLAATLNAQVVQGETAVSLRSR